MFRGFIFAFAIAVTAVAPALAQSPADRNKARIENRVGWDYMKSEQFEPAVKAFQSAVEIDPTFEVPWYGLGRAHLALKQFVAATSALERCRTLYEQQAGRQFTNQQEAQRYRRDRIIEIDEMIRLQQSGRPTTAQQQPQTSTKLEEHRRQLQEYIARGDSVTLENAVPAWVSLSLGSAYFRSGKLPEAERAFKAAVEADRRSGEALNNLAVVYFETERFDLALTAVESAKKTGFKVNPELEREIRSRLK
jgi:tetratricopeptide (TPR) repeat protein